MNKRLSQVENAFTNLIKRYHALIQKVEFLCSNPCISVSLATDAPGQLNVLGHDGDSLGVNCTEVGVFKQADHVGFACLLDGEHCLRLESQVTLVLCGNLSHQSLEGQLADEQLCRLLELPDLSEGNGAWSESVGLLDTFVSDIGGLPGSLVCQLLAWCFGSCVLASGLFRAGHLVIASSLGKVKLIDYNLSRCPFKATGLTFEYSDYWSKLTEQIFLTEKLVEGFNRNNQI